MASGEAAEKAKGHSSGIPEEWKDCIEKHLTIRFNKERNLIELGWASNCGDKSCPVPHTTVAFYSCPSRPCPPWGS
ncbi:MAG TPA: hypothetical protein VJN21_08685 [Candidatus Acidoferrales bacterium]|nr:hypothetical protein [Candidatus Acidoferrales bacterium]